MLPKNLINKAKKSTGGVNNEPEQQQEIINVETNNSGEQQSNTTPQRNINRFIPTNIARNKRTQQIQENTENSNVNEKKQQSTEDENGKAVYRAGYLTYPYTFLQKSLTFFKSLYQADNNKVDELLVAFPITYVMRKVNSFTIALGTYIEPSLILPLDQVVSIANNNDVFEKFYGDLTELNFQYASRINLTAISRTINRSSVRSFAKYNVIPLTAVVFNEFKETLIDLMLKYSDGELGKYEIPESGIIIPVGAYGELSNLFDISNSIERMYRGKYQIFLDYSSDDDLLIMYLIPIHEDLSQYSQSIAGYTLAIPISKLSARIFASALMGVK
jgi:hypothetical protein